MSQLFVDKLAPLFVYPLGLSLVCLAVLLIWISRPIPKLLGALVLALLWCASTPILSNALSRRLESSCPAMTFEQVNIHPALVLLGGIVSGEAVATAPAEFGDAIDRLLAVLRLYRLGKAPLIIISGGNLPWTKGVPEAEVLRDLLVELGVPAAAIHLDTESRNTRENAVNTARIFAELRITSGILVTSASHMPRALASFRSAGLELDYFSTDFRARKDVFESVLDVLPDADSLATTTSVLKEDLGYFVYHIRGWLTPPSRGTC